MIENRKSILPLLQSYPRQRPPLSPKHESTYLEDYRRNRLGLGPVQRVANAAERWMHRRVAASRKSGSAILEIGAGTLNHLPFENDFAVYDVVEPLADLYEDSPFRGRIGSFYADITAVPPERRYDRVISVAVLEHLTDLPTAVAVAGLHLGDGGRFAAGIPSEGGFLWGLGWRCTTGLAYWLRTSRSYGVLMRHEHVSRADEIIRVIHVFFGNVTLRRFPLPLHHFSLYCYIDAQYPDRCRCQEFLDGRVEEVSSAF